MMMPDASNLLPTAPRTLLLEIRTLVRKLPHNRPATCAPGYSHGCAVTRPPQSHVNATATKLLAPFQISLRVRDTGSTTGQDPEQAFVQVPQMTSYDLHQVTLLCPQFPYM